MVGKRLKEDQDKKMIIELRSKSQITLPKGVIRSLGLMKGDKFEVIVVDGEIHFIPVAVYPKAVVERWGREFDQLRKDLNTTGAAEASGEGVKSGQEGDQPRKVYKNLDEAMADLDATYGLKDVTDNQ